MDSEHFIEYYFLFIFLVLAAIVVIHYTTDVFRRPRRRRLLKKLAEEYGLRYFEDDPERAQWVAGVFNHTVVLVISGTPTCAAGCFAMPMPEALVFSVGTTPSWPKDAGIHHWLFPRPEDEQQTGTGKRATTAILEEYRRRLIAVSKLDKPEAHVSAGFATAFWAGPALNDPALKWLLVQASGLARRMEGALAWDPATEPQAPAVLPENTPPAVAEVEEEIPGKRSITAAAPPGDSDAAGAAEAQARTQLADRIVAQLAAEGTDHEEGFFTIDPVFARKKMSQFQLPHPGFFVLHLIQAAVLKDATSIEISSGRDIRVTHDGRPFTVKELELLWSALFTPSEDPDSQALRHLAVGLNTALGLKPDEIRVLSTDGHRQAVLKVAPDATDELTESKSATELKPAAGPESPTAWTEIEVRRFTSRKLPGGPRKIGDLVRDRAVYAPAAVIVDGERVSRGRRAAGCWGLVQLEGPVKGFCGFAPALGQRAELHLVQNGVRICTHELEAAGPGFLSIMDTADLKVDLSLSEVVRGPAYDALLAKVRMAEPAAERQLCADLQGDLLAEGLAQQRRWAERLLKDRLARFTTVQTLQPDGAARYLADAPLWPAIDGTRISLSTLIARLDSGRPVEFSDYSLQWLCIDEAEALNAEIDPATTLHVHISSDSQDRAYLARIFGSNLSSRTKDLLALPRGPEKVHSMARAAFKRLKPLMRAGTIGPLPSVDMLVKYDSPPRI